MARPIPRLLIGLALTNVWACADVDDMSLAGQGDDASAPTMDDVTLAGPRTCVTGRTISCISKPADILILLDRSESMSLAYGGSTRYQVLAAVLTDLVQSYAAHVRFGYDEMPSRQICEPPTPSSPLPCPPLVGLAEKNAALVTAAIAAAPPLDGSTPTAKALQKAYAYYKTLPRDTKAKRYVILATDGAPNYNMAGELANQDLFHEGKRLAGPCFDAVAQVENLRKLIPPVHVLVLASESSLTDGGGGSDALKCLRDLAAAGAPPNASRTTYYSVGSPGEPQNTTVSELQDIIEKSFGVTERPERTLKLPRLSDVQGLITVRLDGQSIPRVFGDKDHGWNLDSSTATVTVTGKYGDQLERFQVHSVEAVYPCSPPDAGPVGGY